MSVRRMYYMACDLCLEMLDQSDGDSPAEVRKYARDARWERRRVPGQRRLIDVCPRCQSLAPPQPAP